MNRLREAFLAALLLAAASFLFVAPWRPNGTTYPLSYPAGAEINASVDVVTWSFVYAHAARAFREGRGWFEAPILLPIENPLAMMDHRLFEGLWSIPLFLRLAPLTAWGWLLLLSIWTTSLTSYALGRWITGSPWGGAAAAVLFAFSPHQAGRLTLSIYLQSTLWIPLWVLALVAYLERRTFVRAILLGLATAFTAIDYTYHALHAAVLLPPVLAWAFWRRGLTLREALLPLLLSVLFAAPILIPIMRAYAEFHEATGLERMAGRVSQASADHWSWLTTPGGRLLFPGGPLVASLVPYPSSFLFPGFIVLAAAAAGARSLLRRASEVCLLGLGGVLLTFGTGERLFWALGLPPLPIGLYSLIRLFPPGRAFGTPTTAVPFVTIVLAVAGSLAAARWAESSRRARWGVAGLLLLSFLEARAAMRETSIRPPRADDPAYAWIAEQAGDFAVADLPMGRIVDLDGQSMELEAHWSAWIHGRTTPNGTTTTVVSWHDAIAAHLARPRRGVSDVLLRALGVRYVVARDPALAGEYRALGLRPAFSSPVGSLVLEVDGAAPPTRSIGLLQMEMLGAVHRRLADPARGACRIEAPARFEIPAQAPFILPVVVTNTGDETWCAEASIFPEGRSVSLGIRTWKGGAEIEPIDFVGNPLTGRGYLPYDVAPGETAVVLLHGQAPRRAGRYSMEMGLLIEGVGWFPGGRAEAEAIVVSPLVRRIPPWGVFPE